jgi:hypothetical protein
MKYPSLFKVRVSISWLWFKELKGVSFKVNFYHEKGVKDVVFFVQLVVQVMEVIGIELCCCTNLGQFNIHMSSKMMLDM